MLIERHIVITGISGQIVKLGFTTTKETLQINNIIFMASYRRVSSLLQLAKYYKGRLFFVTRFDRFV
jgi:hypothetical protein